MTRKKIMLFIGILIALVFLGKTVYKIVNFSKALDDERRRYASQLSYDISSRVDSVRQNDTGGVPGTVFCTITKGKFDHSMEDSLAKTLLHHTRLRFNEATTAGLLEFIMPGAERWEAGDSLVINSALNELKFFRKGNQIYSDQLSNLLEGRVMKGL